MWGWFGRLACEPLDAIHTGYGLKPALRTMGRSISAVRDDAKHVDYVRMTAPHDAIMSLCADLDAGAVESFLARLGSDYLDCFDPPVIAEHLHALVGLSGDAPVTLILRQSADGRNDCTVVAFDHPFEFSLIAGVLAGTGFGIESSDVFTLERPRVATPAPRHHKRRPILRRHDPLSEPVILDHFRGRLLGPLDEYASWSAVFRPALTGVVGLLDRGDEPSADRAKRLVNERVTQWLIVRCADNPGAADMRSILQPIGIRIARESARTRLYLPRRTRRPFSMPWARRCHCTDFRSRRRAFARRTGRPLTRSTSWAQPAGRSSIRSNWTISNSRRC